MEYLIIRAYHLWIDFEQVVLSHLFIWTLSNTHLYLLDFVFSMFLRDQCIFQIFMSKLQSQSSDCFTALNSREVFASPLHGDERPQFASPCSAMFTGAEWHCLFT